MITETNEEAAETGYDFFYNVCNTFGVTQYSSADGLVYSDVQNAAAAGVSKEYGAYIANGEFNNAFDELEIAAGSTSTSKFIYHTLSGPLTNNFAACMNMGFEMGLQLIQTDGDVTVSKVDEEGNALDGAEFKLYRLNGETKEYYTLVDNTVTWITAEADASVLTGGTFTVTLPFGTYYLSEITSPSGYNGLSEDLEFIVDGVSETVSVTNTEQSSGGGSSYDYYDVTVNYYDQDGNVIHTQYVSGDIREGRSWDVTDRQLDTITYNGVTYTFDRAEGDPLSGTNIREDKVIDLYYTAEGEDIPDPEVPEGELPTDPTDPGTTDPTQPGDSTDLEDPDVPTAEVPETGDASLIWAAAALLSGIGLAWLSLSGKKREEHA